MSLARWIFGQKVLVSGIHEDLKLLEKTLMKIHLSLICRPQVGSFTNIMLLQTDATLVPPFNY